MRLERAAELGKLLLCLFFVLRKNYKLQIADLTGIEVNIREEIEKERGRIGKRGRNHYRKSFSPKCSSSLKDLPLRGTVTVSAAFFPSQLKLN